MNVDKLISALSQSGLASGLAGGLAGGALSGALVNSKKARKHAGTALKVGGIAAVGALAWNAYCNYRDNDPARSAAAPVTPPPPPMRPSLTSTASRHSNDTVSSLPAANGSRGLLIVRAMIAAAKADGHIDDEERRRIFTKVEALSLTGAETALLFDELTRPVDLDRLLENVGDVETATEVYAASLIAIDTSRPEGRVYLSDLAERLILPPPLVREIHAQLEHHDAAA